MQNRQRIFLIFGISLFLFLVSYKYSLYQTKSMLSLLATPQTLPLFTKILTFALMMIGVPPTILIILFNTFFCHTALVSWEIQTICFGSPFFFSGNDGFFAYIIASLMCALVVGYAIFLAIKK